MCVCVLCYVCMFRLGMLRCVYACNICMYVCMYGLIVCMYACGRLCSV